MLRLTAKDTLFGKPTFSSWLIEASGALPIARQKDHGSQKIDNSRVMNILKEVLVPLQTLLGSQRLTSLMYLVVGEW
jgi:1-acyl-sn-glycerol-3-phosphate acyltransferase